jgi:sugar phosphate isomerase/epimerase
LRPGLGPIIRMSQVRQENEQSCAGDPPALGGAECKGWGCDRVGTVHLHVAGATKKMNEHRFSTNRGGGDRGDLVRFAICNEIFGGWAIEDVLAYAAKTGYDAVEIAPFTMAPRVTEISASERVRIRDLAARAGIAICGIHWILVKTEGLHLTHPERAVRQRTSAYFCELVDFCADVGGRTIVLGSPKQREILEGVTSAQAWDWAAGTLREAVKVAEAREIVICIEPLAPAETDFLNTAEEALRFAGQFDSASMKIVLDVNAMSSESRPIPQIIRESWPHFAHFHANDPNRKGPGFGAVEYRPILAALREVGYEGYVSVEVFDFEDGPERIATRSLDYLRGSFVVEQFAD